MERYWANVPEVYQAGFWVILFFATIIALYKFTFRAYKRRWAIMRKGVRVKAKVTGYRKIELGEDPDKAILYRCYLEFETKDGEKCTIVPEQDYTYKFTDGATLTIYYLEKNPQKFVIKELLPYQIKLLPLGVLIMAICLYKIVSLGL